MTLLAPYKGKVLMLKSFLNVSETTDLQLKLFVNDVSPEVTDINGKYEELATGSGYTSVTLSGSSWNVSEGIPCVASYPAVHIVFTNYIASPIYGYYIVEPTSNILMWVERFTRPFVVDNNGDELVITPRITLG